MRVEHGELSTTRVMIQRVTVQPMKGTTRPSSEQDLQLMNGLHAGTHPRITAKAESERVSGKHPASFRSSACSWRLCGWQHNYPVLAFQRPLAIQLGNIVRCCNHVARRSASLKSPGAIALPFSMETPSIASRPSSANTIIPPGRRRHELRSLGTFNRGFFCVSASGPEWKIDEHAPWMVSK